MTDIFINNKKFKCLCDTGAEVNLIPAELAEKHCLSLSPVNGVQPVSVDQTTRGSENTNRATEHVKFYALSRHWIWNFELPLPSHLGAKIDCATKTIRIDNLVYNVEASPPTATIATATVCRVRLVESTVMHPRQERFLSACVEGTAVTPFKGVVEPTS